MTVFEKDPIDLAALHLGLSPEAAEQHYTARWHRPRRTFCIEGSHYFAVGRVDALDQHEDETGRRSELDDVVEVV